MTRGRRAEAAEQGGCRGGSERSAPATSGSDFFFFFFPKAHLISLALKPRPPL